MGWTVIGYREPGQSHRDFFQREVLSEGSEIVASHFEGGIGGTFYAAVRSGSEVWALVVLTTGRSGGEFGWKEMDETQGPAEADCPPRILDLLTPTESEHALQWRARCREAAERRAAVLPGATVEFGADFLTPSGPCKRFEVVNPAKGQFRALVDGVVYRLAGWRGELKKVMA